MIDTSAVPMLTDETFAEAVAPGSGLVAVDFSAEWCGPCKIMAPIVESMAGEFAGRLKVYQLDNDANPQTIARLGVRGLPTMLVFRDGEIVARVVGTVSKATLREKMERLLSS